LFDLVLTVALIALLFDMTLAVYLAKKAKLGSIMENIEGWIEEWREGGGIEQILPYKDEGTGEWRVDERIGQLCDFIGSRLALSMRQAAFQQMGVDSKLQKGVDKAIGADLLDGSGIGGILDILGMGETKQMLAKNPKTLGIILQRVAPLLNQYLGKNPGSGESSSHFRSKY